MSRKLISVQDLSGEAKLVIALTVGFVVFRSILATQSSFPFHQGWNEGHYALVAAGFESHLLVPRYGSNHVYNVPPLFPYAVWLSFSLLGTTELAARLPSILAAAAMLPATYSLGIQLFAERRTALTGAVILATLPYFQLYGGRAQTDILMTALLAMALVAVIEGYDASRTRNWWLVVGGGFFAAAVTAKQPSILLAAVVLTYLVLRRQFDRDTLRRTVVLIVASVVALLPLVAWLALNYLVAPSAFVGKWEHELFHRTTPFANLPLLLAISGVLGFTLPVIVLAVLGGMSVEWPWNHDTREPFAQPSVLLVWVVVVGAFVAYRTPQGHQYYAVALLPPLALLTAQGIDTVRPRAERVGVPSAPQVILGIVLLSTVTGSLVLFEFSGEFSAVERGGERISADAGRFLASSVPADSQVLVASGFTPQIQWYARGTLDPGQVSSYTVGNLSADRVRDVAENASGPVYVVAPSPSWSPIPAEMLEEVHMTRPYEPTATSILDRPPIDVTKFGFYVADRRLVVYRVVATQQ